MPVGARTVDLGVTDLWWVTTIAAFPAVTAVEVNAGVHLTPFLVTDYAVHFDPSASVNQMGVGDVTDINVPTIGKYSGSLHWFRSYQAGGTIGSDDLSTVFTGVGVTGYIARRIGIPIATAPTTGQVWEFYKFITDNNQTEGGNAQGYLTATTPLFSIGVAKLNVTLT